MIRLFSLALILALTAAGPLAAQDKKPAKKPDGNRLAYLDEVNPYYPHKDFAKLITPQWVGEEGVEAVVILAIDDMKKPKRYEAYLRPILNRLKKIDGRAPVSIMTCSIDPKDPQLQTWLKEGLSLECHTFDHPCPFFTKGFAKAKETYDKCVDLLHEAPGTKPVAFRMPCCDSMNTPSPRFYAEIFNKTTDKKNFLSIDSSVFNVFTSADPELPKELVLDDKGQERFKPYLPADRSFVNTIENYPYPYVIGRLCWQFPCMTPSDWQAQHRHKPTNPQTVADWKAALDCTVIKKGVFCMVFHPHGWIKNDQVVEFIDHAVAKHGKKVKFLTFKEAMERLNSNLLRGQPLRDPKNSPFFGIRVLDVNNDGFIDVALDSRKKAKRCSVWVNSSGSWLDSSFEFRIDPQTPFMVFDKKGYASTEDFSFLLHFDGKKWWLDKEMSFDRARSYDWLRGNFKTAGAKITGFAYRDLDGDGCCEQLISGENFSVVLRLSPTDSTWKILPFKGPQRSQFGVFPLHDTGLRFLDLDGDGKLDIIFSNEKEYGVYLFTDMEKGWSKKIMAGKRGDADALPMIARNGTDNGFWMHSGHLWWANEDTATLKDHVDRRNIKDLLKQK